MGMDDKGSGSRRQLRVLMVEDSPFDAELLLARMGVGFSLHWRRVDNAIELQKALDDEPWDIILSDHNMPRFSSTEALAIVKKGMHLDVPFLIVSGSIGEEVAVESMRAGASDYILKDNLTRLVPAIERELRDAAERRELRRAETALVEQNEQMRIAREIQQRLLPARAPAVPNFDIAGSSRPADATGGDYFDYIVTPQGLVVAVVGDVSGHGIGAALLVTDTREALRAFAASGSEPREMLLRADRLLRCDFGDEHFITLSFVVLDPASGTIAHVGCGHPSGYILDAAGNVIHTLSSQGPALCLPETEPRIPRLNPIRLRPGDTTILLTDGAIEATSNDVELGATGVLDAVRAHLDKPASAIVQKLFDHIGNYLSGQPPQDDVTAVVIKYTGPSA